MSARESKIIGTATTAAAEIKFFVVMVVFQGNDTDPPIIARDSMRAAGATAVKKVDVTIFEPFLSPKLNNFLTPDINAPVQVLL